MTVNIQLKQVQQILLEIWDPIGIGGVEGCADEYDNYAYDIYSMLLDGEKREVLKDYLVEIEVDFMGLTPNANRVNDTLNALLELKS